MTQLQENELLPAQNVPVQVSEFFSYDRFQLLWRDLCSAEDKKTKSPVVNGCFFGIRNVVGKNVDGRNTVINMAILADAHEADLLSNAVKTALGDYLSFKKALLNWFSVGGVCSYGIDVKSFRNWLDKATKTSKLCTLEEFDPKLKPMMKFIDRNKAPKKEAMLLRLGVYTTSREDIVKVMGGKKLWKHRHPCAITPDTFVQLFERPGAIWKPQE